MSRSPDDDLMPHLRAAARIAHAQGVALSGFSVQAFEAYRAEATPEPEPPAEPTDKPKQSLSDWINDPERIRLWREHQAREDAEIAAAKEARVYPALYPANALGKVVSVDEHGVATMGRMVVIPELSAEPVFAETTVKHRQLTLTETSSACPEQYDVWIGEQQVGYIRLRHGVFRVDYPDCGGETVCSDLPRGDGRFEPDERDHYLDLARARLYERWLQDWGDATPEQLADEVARQKAERQADEEQREQRLTEWMAAKRKESEASE